jgi:hypothetical protein
MTESVDKSPPIADAVSEFIHDLEGIKRAEQIACPLIQALAHQTSQEFQDFAVPFKVETDSDGVTKYLVPFEADQAFRAVRRKHKLTSSAFTQTPRALFVAMVSAFDAYLGRFLRSIFILKPELIHASQRSLSFQELVSFESLEAAREHIIAEEIDSFLRNSHIDHFDWLENRLNMPLRKDMPSWSTFVEVTQRRNLYVHCDGMVSKQYLDICRKNGVPVDEVIVGSPLKIDAKYFDRAFSCLFEIGVKLAHVTWRKLAPSQLESADNALNQVCFELLQNERYKLAHELLTFATSTLKKHSSALNRRIFVINLAIAVKFGKIGDPADSLKNEDWSDCAIHFSLAKAVLEDAFDKAAEIMKAIGPDGVMVNRSAYDSWPLFKAFRETDQFRDTYKELFGQEFIVEQMPSNTVAPPAIDESIIDDEMPEQSYEQEPTTTPDMKS